MKMSIHCSFCNNGRDSPVQLSCDSAAMPKLQKGKGYIFRRIFLTPRNAVISRAIMKGENIKTAELFSKNDSH